LKREGDGDIAFSRGREKLFEKASPSPCPLSHFKNFQKKGFCNRNIVLFSADIHL